MPTRSSWLHESRVVFIILVAAVGVAAAAGSERSADAPRSGKMGMQVPDIDGLIEGLKGDAFYPGRKDTADTLEPMRVGWGLWDAGEGEGGYTNLVAQFEHPAQNYDDAGADATQAEIFAKIYPVLYQKCYSRFVSFSTPGPGMCVDMCGMPCDDFASAFSAPGVDFFMFQGAVYSPVRDDAQYPIDFYTFPHFTQNVAPRAQSEGIAFAQNIGFANHRFFTHGEFDFNFDNPVITLEKALPLPLSRVPQESGISLADVQHPGEELQNPSSILQYPVLSMVRPAVASQLEVSIAERVDTLANQGTPPVYSMIGGEYTIYLNSEFKNADCSQVTDELTYVLCLATADYSDESYTHFRKWLERRYSTLQGVEAAWGLAGGSLCQDPRCTQCTFDTCGALDPAAPPASVAFQPLFDDWLAFQREQIRIEARGFQYNAAKSHQPGGRMYQLTQGFAGAEHGALYSDGVASVNFYGHTSNLDPIMGQVLTSMKRTALHALSYGESVNFPLFEVLGDSNDTSCYPAPLPPMAPTYEPSCHEQAFAMRTFREFVTLGVDSFGVGYWEVGGHYGNRFSDLPQLVADMGGEAAGVRTRRAFMTPWRSPVVVHTGQVFGVEHTAPPPMTACDRSDTNLVLDILSEQQAQVAVFSEAAGFDDLWLTSAREVLLSPFVCDLDAELTRLYVERAARHAWEVRLLTDDVTLAAFKAAGEGFLGNDIPMGPTFPGTVTELITEDGSQTVVGLIVGFDLSGQRPQVETLLRNALANDLENLSAGTIWPVQALDPVTDTFPDPPAAVTVMSDGLGFLVSVGNTDTSQALSVRLDVLATPGGAVVGHAVEGGATFSIAATGAELRYVQADIPELAQPGVDSALAQQVATYRGHVGARDTANFAVDAALAVLAELDHIGQNDPGRREKLLAGLLRLRRMTFSKYVEGLDQLVVVDLFGNAVAGAPVQAEYPLFHHHRSDLGAGLITTGAQGVASVPSDPPVGVELWDFVNLEYTSEPGLAGQGMVEIHVQHPSFKTQGAVLRAFVR